MIYHFNTDLPLETVTLNYLIVYKSEFNNYWWTLCFVQGNTAILIFMSIIPEKRYCQHLKLMKISWNGEMCNTLQINRGQMDSTVWAQNYQKTKCLQNIKWFSVIQIKWKMRFEQYTGHINFYQILLVYFHKIKSEQWRIHPWGLQYCDMHQGRTQAVPATLWTWRNDMIRISEWEC